MLNLLSILIGIYIIVGIIYFIKEFLSNPFTTIIFSPILLFFGPLWWLDEKYEK